MPALYDRIGDGYAGLRRADPRIAAKLVAALGPPAPLLNVGAGTGNYEPADRWVVAVEPSVEMIRQRTARAAPAVRAVAQALPFADGAFEAGLAVLTVHHWPDPIAGLRELRRVVRGRIVILTFDPAARPWLTDYIPGLAALDEARMPALDVYEAALGPVRITPLAIPHDCTDGFLYTYWRRPEAYLDARIRSGSSSFRALADTGAGLERLRADLESGEWDRRYGGLRGLETYEAGYRLIVSG
ncbi:methyltransferase domain-containing protein [Phenylobacterium sp.]|uniref:class I SAM-dependent methyltransferase n=1 Tax=Phenylobacterium sp. TaxID=1871053 RepID=UPI0025DBE683|nr:methyltransferase domain-containing protein [Phenylobacterium sp.]MCA3719868.1 class I SAM-dependent methyltransferase [Phenylobacterium sp.]